MKGYNLVHRIKAYTMKREIIDSFSFDFKTFDAAMTQLYREVVRDAQKAQLEAARAYLNR
jgi:hypothetical protein